MKKLVCLFVCLLCLLVPQAALAAAETSTAQTVEPVVKNPSAIAFMPSTDHAATGLVYELQLLKADGAVIQTLNLGKPACVVGTECTVPVNVQPIAFDTGMSMRLRVVVGTAASDYAVSVNKFDRVPGPPSKVIAK